MIRPSLTSASPAIIDSTVLFPQPLCPMSATNSPSAISRSKPFTTDTGPLGVRKVLVRLEHLRCFFMSDPHPDPLPGYRERGPAAPQRRTVGQIDRLELRQCRQLRLLLLRIAGA